MYFSSHISSLLKSSYKWLNMQCLIWFSSVQFMFYLTTRESLIGHSRWALPHYTEMGHSSRSFWGTASPDRGSNPRSPVPMALNIPEGHRGIGIIWFNFASNLVLFLYMNLKKNCTCRSLNNQTGFIISIDMHILMTSWLESRSLLWTLFNCTQMNSLINFKSSKIQIKFSSFWLPQAFCFYDVRISHRFTSSLIAPWSQATRWGPLTTSFKRRVRCETLMSSTAPSSGSQSSRRQKSPLAELASWYWLCHDKRIGMINSFVNMKGIHRLMRSKYMYYDVLRILRQRHYRCTYCPTPVLFIF